MPIPAGIQARLTAININNGNPGWTIVNNAGLLPPFPAYGMGPVALTAATPQQVMQKLMRAFYDYGRLHFTWSQSSPATAGGGGLLRGSATNCACATFNLNLQVLAEACGLDGNAITLITFTEQFITVPNIVCIDRNWVGNVRTDRETFHQFKSFKFMSHYWLNFQGMNYDTCFNNTFINREQIVFSRLLPAENSAMKDAGVGDDAVYKLAKPLPVYDHLVMTSKQGPGGWPSWQLVSRAQLKALRS